MFYGKISILLFLDYFQLPQYSEFEDNDDTHSWVDEIAVGNFEDFDSNLGVS